MKLSIAATAFVLLPALASAFVTTSNQSRSTPTSRAFVPAARLQAKKAASFEEDLEMTRDVIAKFMDSKDGVTSASAEEAAAEPAPADAAQTNKGKKSKSEEE